jgi:hypothetical protein
MRRMLVKKERAGVLYGQREEKIGENVTVTMRNAHAHTSGSVVCPITGCISTVK